jgi:hypothetical protein
MAAWSNVLSLANGAQRPDCVSCWLAWQLGSFQFFRLMAKTSRWPRSWIDDNFSCLPTQAQRRSRQTPGRCSCSSRCSYRCTWARARGPGNLERLNPHARCRVCMASPWPHRSFSRCPPALMGDVSALERKPYSMHKMYQVDA